MYSSATSSSTFLPSTSTSKASYKAKPVNVFSNDGSFLERFQRGKQEEDDRRKAEDALAKKRQFADRFKNRGKRPSPPDSSPAVTNTDDVDPNPAKKPKLEDATSNSKYRHEVRDQTSRILKNTGTGTGVHALVK